MPPRKLSGISSRVRLSKLNEITLCGVTDGVSVTVGEGVIVGVSVAVAVAVAVGVSVAVAVAVGGAVAVSVGVWLGVMVGVAVGGVMALQPTATKPINSHVMMRVCEFVISLCESVYHARAQPAQ